ncbi:TPM domain-containing protein [Hathewaya massiliensis]|uniref:TPM domain-containing protein n=1 Tax=Hathewaya massiliensis TaxID=1964382 RepID=UPI001157106E|nr:TPM domain-containing protein [Hathewaya massiliensis]
MKNKISLKVILFLLCLSMFIPLASNTVIAFAENKQRVYDFAEIFSKDEIKDLEIMCNEYSSKKETDFIILTTNETGGRETIKYMQDFYDEKALGYDKPHGNCAILTIDMQNRYVYLAGFYKAKEYLDDNRLAIIRKKITSDLTNKNYYKASETFIKTSYKYMGIRPGVNPNNIFLQIWFQIVVSLGVAAISVIIMVYNSGGTVTVNGNTYIDSKNSRVIEGRDDYIRTTVTRTKKSSDNSSSGGSSGGGGGVTSGGHSHSGSGGSF